MITRLPPRAEILAYLSVVPFVLCLLGVALAPEYDQRALAQHVAIAYGAVVLAFSGAVHWALALAGQLSWRPARLAGASAPALVGVGAVVLGGQRGLALLAVGVGVFWLYEHRHVGGELPPEYLALRRNLSLAICLLLALTLMLCDGAGLA